jgi:hypothetical protein
MTGYVRLAAVFITGLIVGVMLVQIISTSGRNS